LNFAQPSNYENIYILPSGTGPYRLTEWMDSELIALGLNENYRDSSYHALARRLEFYLDLNREDAASRMAGGRLDIVTGLTDNLIDKNLLVSGAKITQEPSRHFSYLVFNINKAPFNSSALRSAAAASLDLGKLVNEVCGGAAVSPEEFLAYWYAMDPEEISVSGNPDAAFDILAQAGYGPDADDTPMPSVTIDCGPSELSYALAEFCASSFKALGFTVDISVHTNSELRYLIRTGETSVYIGEYFDHTNGLGDFFAKVVDSRYQKVIPDGSWMQDVRYGYRTAGKAQLYYFEDAAASLDNSNILLFLAYHDLYMASIPFE